MYFIVFLPGVTADQRSFPTRRSSDLPDDELPQGKSCCRPRCCLAHQSLADRISFKRVPAGLKEIRSASRSEEHTSELQSLTNLVCRLLHEKTNQAHRPESGGERAREG